MNYKKLNKSESENIFRNWADSGIPADAYEYCESEFVGLRKSILEIFNTIKADHQITDVSKQQYKTDLYFGLKLYGLLNPQVDFSLREASDDRIWRYLSLKVVPDIVAERWDINEGRFWKEPRRMWLKTVWWYIHLSWQGSEEETEKILRDNTTDEIVQLVERAGPNGYRIGLCRTLMLEYSKIALDKRKSSPGLFRIIMKLNTARVKVMEPSLVEGGEKDYVRSLFEYFE